MVGDLKCDTNDDDNDGDDDDDQTTKPLEHSRSRHEDRDQPLEIKLN